MKAGITGALSISGVLVAGAAAAFVNSTVLSSSGQVAKAPISVEVSADSIPVVVVEQSSTQAVYQVEGIGSVTVDTSGGGLTVLSVDPIDGWRVLSTSTENGQLSVVFADAAGTTGSIEFVATLAGGLVRTNVAALGEPTSPAAAGGAAASPPASNSPSAPGTTTATSTGTRPTSPASTPATSPAGTPTTTRGSAPPTTPTTPSTPSTRVTTTTVDDGHDDGDDGEDDDEEEEEDD